MHTIWKYDLDVTDDQEIQMVAGAKILHVGQQEAGKLTLWALVDLPDGPDAAPLTETRTFRVAGTGHALGNIDKLDFIGTVVTAGGALIWHVFEVTA